MKRYDIISKLLQDELGYELINHNVENNIHTWTFIKDGKTINIDETTIFDHYSNKPSYYKESLKHAHINLLNEIKKTPLNL